MGMTVVMPALDEADALPAALAGRPDGVPVVVVDNGSTDATATVARKLGASVVTEPRRGFGAACLAGALAAPEDAILVFVDADATFAWDDVLAIGSMVEQGHADLALSWRRRDLRARGAMPWHVAAANSVLGAVASRRAGVRLHDLGPLRAIARHDVLALDLTERTYGWPLEMVLAAGDRGLRIRERAVRYRVRAGTSKVTGRPVATLRTVMRMLAVLARFAVSDRRPATSPEDVGSRAGRPPRPRGSFRRPGR